MELIGIADTDFFVTFSSGSFELFYNSKCCMETHDTLGIQCSVG